MSEGLRKTIGLLISPSERFQIDIERARQEIKDLLDPTKPEYEPEKADLIEYVSGLKESSAFSSLESVIRCLLEAGVDKNLISEIINGWRNSDDINLISIAKKTKRWTKSLQLKPEEEEEQFIDLLELTDTEKKTISLLSELRFDDEMVKRYRVFRLFPEVLVKSEPRSIAVISSKGDDADYYRQKLKDNSFKVFTSYLEAKKNIEERRYFNFVVIDFAQPRSEEIERSEIDASKEIVDMLFKISDKLEYIQYSLSEKSGFREIKYNDQWYYYSPIKVKGDPYVIAKVKEDLYCLQFEDRQLPGQHREVLWLFANPNAKKIVYEQIKTGFSGSANYLINAVDDYGQCGEPTIIKITTPEKAKAEEGKYRKIIKPNIPASPVVTKKLYKNGGVGAVCYQYAYLNPGNRSRTFKDLYKSKEKTIPELCELIDELFNKKLKTFNNARGWLSRTINKEFIDYIKKGKIIGSFRIILPNSITDKSIVLYNEKLTNPIVFWDDIRSRDEKYPSKLVHGDLHTENIMIDEESQIFLVDYAKAKEKAHLFIDYAMLEVSIKLDLLPRSIPYSEIVAFEKMLCSWGNLDEDVCYKGTYGELADCLTVIKCIRNSGKSLCERMDTKQYPAFDPLYHYYIVLFCMTLAQLAYIDMNQQYALISSGLLANRLKSMLAKSTKKQ